MKDLAETEAGSSMPIDFALAEGDASAEILAKSDAMPADLLIIGTHGRSGLERFLLGSVTERVLRNSSCPVLTIPPHVIDVVPAPPVIFRRIVCAVDFSTSSMRALEYAAALAQEADAHLTLVHVIGIVPELPPVLQPVADRRKLPETVEQAMRERQIALEAAVPEHVREYCTIEATLTGGIPYEEVLRVAAEQHSDLIVLGARRRRAADLIIFGSTARQVVRRAVCPVLTLAD
jgi:nucleotide-binding universal stress UspA family protein